MSAYLIRLFGASSLLILATVVIAGVLSTHSLAETHPAVGGSVQRVIASSATDPGSREPIAESAGGIDIAVDPRDVSGTPQCCIEPVECVESAVVVPTVLAALSAPAPAFLDAGMPLLLLVDDQTSQPSPSLALLSISRT